ncbi:MAG: hypothetical protein JNJ88_04690, partial [Planctomycetes bacterium]|nr:hypothetical protein [Planctomycetota bacterium]
MSIDTVHARDGALTPGGPLQEKQQANANFGCAMGLAKLALPTSALDDVLISATSETVRILNPPTTFADNGAVYSYKSDALGQLSAGPLRFEPGALESGQRCGNLGMASGQILSTHSYNLQFAGAYRRDMTVNGSVIPNVGAVDVYKTSASLTPAEPLFPQPIRPPVNP